MCHVFRNLHEHKRCFRFNVITLSVRILYCNDIEHPAIYHIISVTQLCACTTCFSWRWNKHTHILTPAQHLNWLMRNNVHWVSFGVCCIYISCCQIYVGESTTKRNIVCWAWHRMNGILVLSDRYGDADFGASLVVHNIYLWRRWIWNFRSTTSLTIKPNVRSSFCFEKNLNNNREQFSLETKSQFEQQQRRKEKQWLWIQQLINFLLWKIFTQFSLLALSSALRLFHRLIYPSHCPSLVSFSIALYH